MTEGELRETLLRVMEQVEKDLAAAHAEIVKLQGGDPAKQTWPVWSSPAHTLTWFKEIRAALASTGPEGATRLAPCPFCGGAMQPRDALWPSEGDSDSIIHAAPTDCPLTDFSLGTSDNGVSVAAAWNRRADGWQDIATAPKNHLPVLVWSIETGRVVAFRDIAWSWWPCPASYPLSAPPTHWQPLPTPPSEQGAEVAAEEQGFDGNPSKEHLPLSPLKHDVPDGQGKAG